MANENSNNNQRPVVVKHPQHVGDRYVFASVQADKHKPVKDDDRPVKPTKKKGK